MEFRSDIPLSRPMYDLDEIAARLQQESIQSITQMLTMTWHHQIRAFLRNPDVMDQRESLMREWLARYDRYVAARLLLLYMRHGLKDGAVPRDYDPEEAERQYGRLVRSRDEMQARSLQRNLGISDQRHHDLGTVRTL